MGATEELGGTEAEVGAGGVEIGSLVLDVLVLVPTRAALKDLVRGGTTLFPAGAGAGIGRGGALLVVGVAKLDCLTSSGVLLDSAVLTLVNLASCFNTVHGKLNRKNMLLEKHATCWLMDAMDAVSR